MATVGLTQESVLKHFMELDDRADINDDYWIKEAQENHEARGGIGATMANKNTLVFINKSVWPSICDGTYFGDHNSPPSIEAQLALHIDKEDIDRIITTHKRESEYLVIYDSSDGDPITDVAFLCRYDPSEDKYSVVHFEGLGN